MGMIDFNQKGILGMVSESNWQRERELERERESWRGKERGGRVGREKESWRDILKERKEREGWRGDR
jgi:hypothetical protein